MTRRGARILLAIVLGAAGALCASLAFSGWRLLLGAAGESLDTRPIAAFAAMLSLGAGCAAAAAISRPGSERAGPHGRTGRSSLVAMAAACGAAGLHGLLLPGIARRAAGLRLEALARSGDGASPGGEALLAAALLAPPLAAAALLACLASARRRRALAAVGIGAAAAALLRLGGGGEAGASSDVAAGTALILLAPAFWRLSRRAGAGREGAAMPPGPAAAVTLLFTMGGAAWAGAFSGFGRLAAQIAGPGRTPGLFLAVAVIVAALGAAAGPRALRRAAAPQRLFGICSALQGLTALAVVVSADLLPDAYLGLLSRGSPAEAGEWGAVLGVVALCATGPAFFAGAALGAAASLPAGARFLAAWAAGAGLGFLIAPALVLAAGLQGGLAFWATLLAVPGALMLLSEGPTPLGRAARALPVLGLAALLFGRLERWDPRLLTAAVSQQPSLYLEGGESRLGERTRHDRLLAFADGAARTAALKLVEGRLPVAYLDGRARPLGGLEARRSDLMAAGLPALLGPERGRALFLAPAPPAAIEALRAVGKFDVSVAALDPVAASAASRIPSLGGEDQEAAAPEGIRLLPLDARRALAAGSEPYDLIVAPPLLTEQEIEGVLREGTLLAARGRLARGGVVGVAVPLRSLAPAGFREAMARFAAAFPEGSAWWVGSDLVLLGGRGPVVAEMGGLGPRVRRPEAAAALSGAGLEDPLKILALHAFEIAALPAAAPQERVRLGPGLARARFRPPLAENLRWIESVLPADPPPVRFPEWWSAEARDAVLRRLAVLRGAQRLTLASFRSLHEGLAGEALEAAEAALRADPSDLAARSLGARALSLQAERRLASDDQEGAEEDYLRALSLDPGAVEPLAALAWIYHGRGEGRRAERLVRRALREAPWAALLHYRLGLLRYEAGDLLEAEASLKRSFEIDPRRPEPLLLLGDVARRRGQDARAAELYDRALAVGGRVAETRAALAALRLDAGDLDGATREVEEAFRAKPGDAEAFFTRARIRAARGDGDGARQDLLAAVTTGGPSYRVRAMAVAALRELLGGGAAGPGEGTAR